MIRFGEWIAKHRPAVLLTAILLLIPSAIGFLHTRVNYDILSYLPDDINTMQGQEILKESFGKGGFSFVITEGMQPREVKETAEQLKSIDHVADVV
ncbi:MAG: hypothetical protein IKG82_14930, partial [Oscillospiraceae bacterium]|nr:hypothetical protein [Oscillospiraceae bacterium]